MCCVWGARYLRATGRRRMLGSFNHGSMANALPMAIGAAFARPGQEVVALCGDGGLSMLLGDLATIVEYKLPVKIVVFDNRSLGMVKLEMEVAGLPDWQTDMCNPDFEAIARAMGIRGFTADAPDSVEAVLTEAFDTPGPVLVNVRTDPNALAMPPKVEFAQMKGFALAMTKLILSGRADEVVATAKEQSETPPRTGLTVAGFALLPVLRTEGACPVCLCALRCSRSPKALPVLRPENPAPCVCLRASVLPSSGGFAVRCAPPFPGRGGYSSGVGASSVRSV